MKPEIDKTNFGSITINSTKYEHDVLIGLDGEVNKRKKKLSKKIYGTSHIVSLDEAKFIHEKGVQKIIIGAGQYTSLSLSDEAKQYFKKKECLVQLLSTPKAIVEWNKAKGNTVGLFHVTC
jgi:hypothetical protein